MNPSHVNGSRNFFSRGLVEISADVALMTTIIDLRTDHWSQIRCPTLFLSGDRDPFARIDLLREKIKLIPDARLEVFKGQGHGLLAVLDQALDVATDFIGKHVK